MGQCPTNIVICMCTTSISEVGGWVPGQSQISTQGLRHRRVTFAFVKGGISPSVERSNFEGHASFFKVGAVTSDLQRQHSLGDNFDTVLRLPEWLTGEFMSTAGNCAWAAAADLLRVL